MGKKKDTPSCTITDPCARAIQASEGNPAPFLAWLESLPAKERPKEWRAIAARATTTGSPTDFAELLGDRTADTLEAIAESFGLSRPAVANWRSLGMPGEPGAYRLADVLRWRLERNAQVAERLERRPRALRDGEDNPLDVKRRADARKAIADAVAKERQNRIANGELLERRAVDREIRESYIEIREGLMRVPRALLPRFPRDLAQELADEVENHIRSALERLGGYQFSWERPGWVSPLAGEGEGAEFAEFD